MTSIKTRGFFGRFLFEIKENAAKESTCFRTDGLLKTVTKQRSNAEEA